MISVDVKTEESVPTNDYINVNIDSAVKVKVSMDPEKMKLAASNFLNKNEEYIRSSVVDVLQGNVREIIGQMKLEEIVQDRKKFADKVQENAAPDMAKMGLDIVSFNVQNVTDKGNVIENLGIDRVVTISKSAQISKAESERDIAVAKAAADKQANDARVEAETAIAEQNNALEIKKQELKKQSDIKKAEADAAYEIQEQEQRKTIEIATADANIAKQEKLLLKDLVDYQDGQVVSKTLVQNNSVSMTLFSFDKGEEISTRAAGGDAMVTVLDGTGRFTVGGEVFILSEGETLIMPKNIPHAVYGEERFKMQLIVSF